MTLKPMIDIWYKKTYNLYILLIGTILMVENCLICKKFYDDISVKNFVCVSLLSLMVFDNFSRIGYV